jgi:predicted PurR-regulated permease PerM
MQIEFSDRQQRTIASAATILAGCVILAALGFVFWLLGTFVARFSSVFLPLAVAAIAALVFNPYFDWMTKKLRFPPVLAVVAVFLSIIVPIAAFSWFFGALIVEQVSELVRQLPAWGKATVDKVREHMPQVVDFLNRYSVLESVSASTEGSGGTIVNGLQAFGSQALRAGFGALSIVGTLLAWVVTPVYFAFFVLAPTLSTGKLDQYLPFLKKDTRDDVVYLVGQFVDIMVAFFRGQLIIAFLQGLLFAVGFSLVGLKYGFVIGLVLGFLNIIPYLGNIVGLGSALPLALFQPEGGWLKVALVLVVFVVVQAIEGYILTPRIMGDRTGLHPMVIIVAIFFWGSALSGILGMILAIPLTAFLVVFWRLAREKWVTELV